MNVDFTIALPLLASGVAVLASLLKNVAVKKNVQSTIMITRPDGSSIRVEAEKMDEDDVKRIIEQVAKLFPATPGKDKASEEEHEVRDRI